MRHKNKIKLGLFLAVFSSCFAISLFNAEDAGATHYVSCGLVTSVSGSTVSVWASAGVGGTGDVWETSVQVRLDSGPWETIGYGSPGATWAYDFVGVSSGAHTVSMIGDISYDASDHSPPSGGQCSEGKTVTVNAATCAQVRVRANIVIPFTLNGPNGYSESANDDDWTDLGTDTGSYSLTYPNTVTIGATTYTRSSGPTTPQTCNANESILFDLVYSAGGGPGSPPGSVTLTGVSCFGWPTPAIETNFGDLGGGVTYHLEKSVNSGAGFGGWSEIASGSFVAMDAYSDSALTANWSYKYRVRASNSDGFGGYSAESASITVNATNCGGSASYNPTLVLDAPAANATVSGSSVSIFGWALDNTAQIETSIVAVQVYIDGAPIGGNIAHTVPRPDVCGVYPARPDCNNVGYGINWDATSVSNNAWHTITVMTSDGNGGTASLNRSVFVSNSGTVNIQTQDSGGTAINASWTLTGPNGNTSGSGPTSMNRPIGTYSVTPGSVSGYTWTMSPNSSQTLAPGDVIGWTVTYTPTITAPTNLVMETAPCGQLRFSWQDNSGPPSEETGFALYYRTSPSGPNIAITTVAGVAGTGTRPQYSWTNPPTGSDLYIVVMAYRTVGASTNYSSALVSSAVQPQTVCTPDLGAFSRKTIAYTNTVNNIDYLAYDPTQAGSDGDLVTFAVRIRNNGNTDVIMNGFTDILRPNPTWDPGSVVQLVRPPAGLNPRPGCPNAETSSGWYLCVDKDADVAYNEASAQETGATVTPTAFPYVNSINVSGRKCTSQNHSDCTPAQDPSCPTVNVCNDWYVMFTAQVRTAVPNARTEVWNTAGLSYAYPVGAPVQQPPLYVHSPRYLINNSRSRVPDFREVAP